MPVLLDTNIAIHIRDRDEDVISRVAALDDQVLLSVITRVELEGGVYRDPAKQGLRRARLDVMLEGMAVLSFDDASADAYRKIVAAAGYSRRKVIDRMIAAQALVHHLPLATMNGGDFADVPGLRLLAW